jgi:hypothetical protein
VDTGSYWTVQGGLGFRYVRESMGSSSLGGPSPQDTDTAGQVYIATKKANYVEACLDADMISPLNLTPGIIRKCCIFLPKIPYRVQLSDIIVLSRATVHDFLDLEAVVDDDVSTDET